MQWITALLAFSTTMLFFSIVVSILVEMIHRTFRLRQAGLRLMLQRYFEFVLKNTKDVDLKGGGTEDTTALKFADDMVTNRAMAASSSEEVSYLKDWWGARLMRGMLDSSKHTDLPVEIFVQKLADEKFLAPSGVPDEVLKDLSQKYVGFGRGMSAYFERRARLFSVIISFFVAWAFYVHPYDLAVAYLKTPELSQDVAAMSKDMLERFNELQPETSKEQAQPADDEKSDVDQADGDAGADGPQNGGQPAVEPARTTEAEGEQPAPSEPASPSGPDAGRQTALPDPVQSSTPDATAESLSDSVQESSPKPEAQSDENAEADLKAIRKDLEDLVGQVASIQNLGVPVGWPKAPSKACEFSTDAAKALAIDNAKRIATSDADDKTEQFCLITASTLFVFGPFVWPSLSGSLWLIIGGLLVGLGAPTWARIVSALTATRGEVAKIAEIVDAVPGTAKAVVLTPNAAFGESAAVKSFKVALAARK